MNAHKFVIIQFMEVYKICYFGTAIQEGTGKLLSNSSVMYFQTIHISWQATLMLEFLIH